MRSLLWVLLELVRETETEREKMRWLARGNTSSRTISPRGVFVST